MNVFFNIFHHNLMLDFESQGQRTNRVDGSNEVGSRADDVEKRVALHKRQVRPFAAMHGQRRCERLVKNAPLHVMRDLVSRDGQAEGARSCSSALIG